MEPNAVEAVLLIMLDLMEEGLIRRGRSTRNLVLQRLHEEWSFSPGERRDAWDDALNSGLIMQAGNGRRPCLTGAGEGAAINLRNSIQRKPAG